MSEPPRREAVDYVILADALSALGYPMRLELLDLLRFPHAVGELRLTPSRQETSGNPERSVARQTVQYHLDKLVEGGFVREEPAEGRAAPRYVVSPQRVYAVIEEMRALSLMFAGRGGSSDATGTIADGARFEPLQGPRLLLVHGVYEGKQFRLDGDATTWSVGRRKGLAICLDYDPFVSLENALVERGADGFTVVDVAGSKNGTSVNWTRLPRGGRRRLVRGDLVGVGRSLLLFRDD
ncbi:MAG TPA: FHA domain-containing protein [Candidatus Thermoplasmatota archaeon]|nr:FHA domain-containing protein [Candidatus Thermoplasmatota archaeon]